MLSTRSFQCFSLGAIVICLLLCASCQEDKHEISVDPVLQEPGNEPPSIIAQGPDFPSGALEIIEYGATPEFFVLVADPNGLDDISIVFFTIDSLIVHDVIVRPDTSTASPGSCYHGPSYADPPTIDIMSLIPRVFPGIKNYPMELQQGGYYTGFSLCIPCEDCWGQFCVFPAVHKASNAFSPSSLWCTSSALFQFVINPPASDTAKVVFVTYLDVEYAGINATVYDAAGATGTATFPNVRIIYTTAEEKLSAP
jgi:hypothetical protein